jgi:hypothetical protein
MPAHRTLFHQALEPGGRFLVSLYFAVTVLF